MRKGLRGLLILGAATAVSLGVSSFDAEAATITPGHVKIDYKAQKLQINQIAGTKDTKFYMATSTVATNSKSKITTVRTAAATEYDAATAGNVTMDLSSFAITKDNYISIWGNKNTDPILVKLPAATTKLKAAVNAEKSEVTINDVTDSKAPKDITSTVEYCTVNGSWSEYVTSKTPTGADFTGYEKLGATIRFRVKATEEAVALPATANVDVGVDKDNKAIKAFAATGNFASNELKAKIAKSAAGPKATIDYNKHTIKIPATSEYRLTLGNATALTAAFTQPTPDKLANGKPATVATLKADDLLKTVTAAIGSADFDLRTAKVPDKKPASKITEYKLPAIGATVAVAQNGTKYAAPAATTTVDKAAVSGNGKADAAGFTGAYVKFSDLVVNARTKAVTGIKLENTLTGTTDKYQVIVSNENTVPAADTTAKAVILNPSTVKNGVTTAKITQVAAKTDQFVFIRKMGDTKTAVWATPYVLLGKVPAAPAEESK